MHGGFNTKLCRTDLTAAFLARYFAPRSGKAALNACENLGGGDPDQKPLAVQKLTIQGRTASARIDDDGEPLTIYLVKRGDRWLLDDFTETTEARYQRQIAASIQPSFRNTPAIDKFVTGELRLADAKGVPALAVTFLRGAVKRVKELHPPAGVKDIHRRLVGAMRAQLAG